MLSPIIIIKRIMTGFNWIFIKYTMNSIKYEYNTVIGHFILINDTSEGFSQDCTLLLQFDDSKNEGIKLAEN